MSREHGTSSRQTVASDYGCGAYGQVSSSPSESDRTPHIEVMIPDNAGNPARQKAPVRQAGEYSATNAWNWNSYNQYWNNNNKNNNNSVLFARTYGETAERGTVTVGEMYLAHELCRAKKKHKRGTKDFEPFALFNCIRLVEDINARRYRLSPSECFIIQYPTPREVFCSAYRDRVVQHFVFNELNPVMDRMLINDTCSCRAGKGTDYAIRRQIRKTRQVSDNYTKPYYVMKMDISGFFMSIDRQRLLEKVLDVIDNRYKGKHSHTLRYLCTMLITADYTLRARRLSPASAWDRLPKHKSLFGNTRTSLPIGNITSQLFANFYLNDIDHFIKSRHKGYIRYVDDMVIIDTDKDRLRQTREMVAVMLSDMGMKLNRKKSIIQKGEYGLPFLGVVVKPHYAVLGKQRINRIYRAKRGFSDPYGTYQSIATRKGMFQRYHGLGVARRWFESIPEEIRKDVRMNTDTSVIWLGDRPVINRKLINIGA